MNNFLTLLDNFFNTGTGFLFGPIMLCVFFGTGILMTIVTRGVQFRKFGVAICTVFGALRKKGDGKGDGQLKPYQALATALSSCVGNGNVVGVSAALVILCSGVGDLVANGTLDAAQAAVISNTAWKLALGGIGDFVVTISLALFCFSTIIGWCTYGETSWEYLFGSKSLIVFRIIHVAFTFIGCVVSAQVLWDAADFCNGVMCIPNLFSLIIFAGLIAKDTKDYIDPMHK